VASSDADRITAGRAIERARTAAETIGSTTLKAMAYAELARAEARQDAAAGRARFEEAVRLAYAKDDTFFLHLLGPSPRFSALKAIGDRMAEAGFLEAALDLAARASTEKDDEWAALGASMIASVAERGARTGALNEKQTDDLFRQSLASAKRAQNPIIGTQWQLFTLLQIAEQLVAAGRFHRAFDAISQAHFTVDPFMVGVATWADSLDSRTRGLSLAVIAAAAEVFGWQRPDWKAVADQITA
jgi:hypothetical protein